MTDTDELPPFPPAKRGPSAWRMAIKKYGVRDLPIWCETSTELLQRLRHATPGAWLWVTVFERDPQPGCPSRTIGSAAYIVLDTRELYIVSERPLSVFEAVFPPSLHVGNYVDLDRWPGSSQTEGRS